MRVLLLLPLLFAFSPIAKAQEACIIFPEARGFETADYVQDVQTCLTAPPSGHWFDETIEAKVLTRVNAERRQRGLNTLEVRFELLDAARIHSLDMAIDGFFAHTGPDGRVASDRASALDRTLIRSEIRENLATFRGDFNWDEIDGALHNILMDSPGHRDNILAPNITHVAMGVARTENGVWLTQVFVAQAGEFEKPLPLRVSPDDRLGETFSLTDWKSAGLQLDTGKLKVDFVGGNLPQAATGIMGDADVLVRGERAIKGGRNVIYLQGPSITTGG